MLATFLVHMGDAVEHEHRRQRQLGVAGAEQFAPPAGEQVLIVELSPPFGRRFLHSFQSFDHFELEYGVVS